MHESNRLLNETFRLPERKVLDGPLIEQAPLTEEWWSSRGGFFGAGYMRGDNSNEGFLAAEPLDLGARTQREVDGIVRILGLETAAAVLDCPCGYGRHSLEMADRGHEVVGVDINEEHLAAAHAALLHSGPRPRLKFQRRDMRDVGYQDTFDAIVNMFYSFGFFEEDNENFRVLTGWRDALKTDGKLLIHTDVNVPRITAGTYRLVETRSLAGGARLHINESYLHRQRRIHGSWTIEDSSGSVRLSPYSMRVFTMEELSEWLHAAGFKAVEAFADWTGNPYRKDAEEMIVVACK